MAEIRRIVNDWLMEMGERHGKAFALEENGICVLKKGDLLLTVEVPEAGHLVYLRLALMELEEVPAEQREELLRELLRASFLGRETSGSAAFGLDPADRVCLWCALDARHLDATGFENIVGHFFALGENWRRRLQDLLSAPAGGGPGEMSEQFLRFRA